MTTSYHHGELAVQSRTGLRVPAGNAVRGIRRHMPAVAAAFLADQPAVFVGAADPEGRLWTTMITGRPGLLTALGDDRVLVAARPAPPDPLSAVLAAPAQVGMIALEPATRRRMRVNGRSSPHAGGLLVELDQVIANCPKYLQKRTPAPEAPADPELTYAGGTLTPAQQQWIRGADTFFVSTAAPDGAADTSHRGGTPGFLTVTSPTRLSWPDYLGNAMFLTLGNLDLRPDAGLLFPDWSTGALLHLSGRATVDYTPERAASVPGAQRVVDFDVESVVEITGGSPLRWNAPEYSRFNPAV